MDARIIAIATKKGGVRKTLFACNVSAGLSTTGFKVAGQPGPLCRSFRVNKQKLKGTSVDALLGDKTIKDIVVRVNAIDPILRRVNE